MNLMFCSSEKLRYSRYGSLRVYNVHKPVIFELWNIPPGRLIYGRSVYMRVYSGNLALHVGNILVWKGHVGDI